MNTQTFSKSLVFAVALAVTGCASTSVETAQVEGNGYKCERVIAAGSYIPRKLCSTAAQRKEKERLAKEFVELNRDLRGRVAAKSGG